MTCPECGKEIRIGQWPFCGSYGEHSRPYGRQGGAVHTSERTAVYRHPGTGKVSYPARNDQPIPEKLQRWGYERVEFTSLREREKFEKANGVYNDTTWFDKGTGNADKLQDVKPIDLTGIEFGPLGD